MNQRSARKKQRRRLITAKEAKSMKAKEALRKVGYRQERPTSQVRRSLRTVLEKLMDDGLHAQPVMLTRYGKPQGVLISVEQYHAVADTLDDLVSTPMIQDRLREADEAESLGIRLDELAEKLGIDVDARRG